MNVARRPAGWVLRGRRLGLAVAALLGATAAPADPGTVLARVDGSEVTEGDVDQALEAALGAHPLTGVDAAARAKVLESLIASRAIAQVEERTLRPDERAQLDRKVRAHREEQLVLQHLAKHFPPEPVSEEAVRVFYEANPEKFGARTVRTCEVLVGRPGGGPSGAEGLEGALRGAGSVQRWEPWADVLNKQGLSVGYRKMQWADGAVDRRLQERVDPLSVGATSDVVWLDGVAWVVRVVDQTKEPPQPLAVVRPEIRRLLAPLQVREAVKRAAAAALKTAAVERVVPSFPPPGRDP